MNIKGGTKLIQEKWLIEDEYKETSIAILQQNLASLRVKLNINQEEMANIIGVSRQTYYSIETGKREMTWTTFLAIVFFFELCEATREMLKELNVFPIDLYIRFNDKQNEIYEE